MRISISLEPKTANILLVYAKQKPKSSRKVLLEKIITDRISEHEKEIELVISNLNKD